MKHFIKQWLVSICLAALPAVAFAYDVQIDGIYYDINDVCKTASVTGTKVGISGAVVIPEAINYNGAQYMVNVIGERAFYGCSRLTSVTIPTSVKTIGDYAFISCTGLISATIPNSVTSIGSYSFSGCTGLISVIIGSSVASIGGYAFSSCSSLTSVTINFSAKALINDCSAYNLFNVFDGCSKLSTLIIGKCVTSVPDYFLFPYFSLENIIVDPENHMYDSRNNCNAIIKSSTNELVFGCRSTIIPNSVTSIGENAFRSCDKLTSIIIPNSITSIGDWAFSSCYGLTSVTIPNSVTSIGADAFSSCKGLTTMTIPSSVTLIDREVFQSCTGLISVIIPNTVTSIGEGAFCNCYGLTSEIKIPHNVEFIGKKAFWLCTSITEVTIEGAKTSFDSNVFDGCSNIKTVNVLSTQPPVGKDDTFATNTYNDATLNVPKTAKDAYSKPACWRNFRHVEEKDFGGVDDVTADDGGICVNVRDRQVEVSGADASEEVRVYDMSGMEIYRGTDRTIMLPTKGVYIVKVAGSTFKVAL